MHSHLSKETIVKKNELMEKYYKVSHGSVSSFFSLFLPYSTAQLNG
jgi:hypothetical protein